MTTKRAKKESTASAHEALESLSNLANLQGPTLDAFTQAGQAYFNGLAAINQEMASFMQTRLRHDMELGESLARCRSLADATKVQSEWLKQATDDYAAETRKLVEMSSGLMRESLATAEPSSASRQAEEPAAGAGESDS